MARKATFKCPFCHNSVTYFPVSKEKDAVPWHAAEVTKTLTCPLSYQPVVLVVALENNMEINERRKG